MKLVLSLLAPPLLAVLTVVWLGRMAACRGLFPAALEEQPWRRITVALLLAGTFWLGVFLPLGLIGAEEIVFDPETVHPVQLFLLHAILAASLILVYVLSFPGGGPMGLARQIGFRPEGALKEIALGFAAGLSIWFVVILALLGLVGALVALGLEDWIPTDPPAAVPWIAGLPIVLRALVSLSAGVVEEAFFRGFLQPRAGILFSSLCFVLAHLSYQQPFMLVGVTLLSLTYAGLVVWRRSVWAAATAHFVFDAVQLLVLIPAALETLPEAVPEAVSGVVQRLLTLLGVC